MSFIIIAVGMPLLLGLIALVVGGVNRNAGSAPVPLHETIESVGQGPQGIVDEGDLIEMLPPDVSDQLSAYASRAAAQAALEAGDIEGYYVVRADYLQNGGLIYVQQEFSPIVDDVDTSRMEWVILTNLIADTELASVVWQPLQLEITSLQPPQSEAEEGNWIVELFPTLMVLILYMVILLPAGMLVNAVTDEKKNRIIEVLMSSVSAQQMITGKILALGLLGLLQTALWVGVLWGVVSLGGAPLRIPPGFEVPPQLLLWTFVYGLLGYAMYGSQMAGLGALAPDLKDTRGASLVIMTPLILVYLLAPVIADHPEGPLALALSTFPLTAPVGMIARMAEVTVPLWQAALAAILQLLAAGLIVRATARLFHAQHLLSGEPFSVRRYMQVMLGQR
jgi:ABC-2 type transport system permease protein